MPKTYETVKKPHGYWTKIRCHKKALKCKSRIEFEEKYVSAHNAARTNGWLDEICSHMELLGNSYLRALYVYEHPDNSVYVGLTWNYEQRYSSHMRKNKILIEKKALGSQVYGSPP